MHSIYGIQDDRLYDLEDHFYYERKFLLRYLDAKTKEAKINNILICLAWSLGVINRFHLDLESELFKRYPYKCPFCLGLPCFCDENKLKKTQKVGRPTSIKPKTIDEWQKLAKKIYINDEIDKLNFEILKTQDRLHYLFRSFRRTLGKTKVKEIGHLAADYFMLLLRLSNILNKDLTKEFNRLFDKGCHVCHKIPCQCYYFE